MATRADQITKKAVTFTRYSVEQLREIVAIADRHSIERAAAERVLSVRQPAASV